ncbi:MAG: hypothetical protein ACKVP4_09860 [Hyphomicrobium sp.]
MHEVLITYASFGAVIVPAIFVMHGIVRWALHAFGAMRLDSPYSARDMRTWPRRVYLMNTTLFALIVTALAAADIDRDSALFYAAISTAIVSGVFVPRAVRLWRAAKEMAQ